MKKVFALCPVRAAIQVIGGKWKLCILYYLTNGPKRYGEMKRAVDGITEKMLTQQLRELEEDGIVVRTVYPQVPPRVDYALTSLGARLVAVFAPLESWGQQLVEQLDGEQLSSRVQSAVLVAAEEVPVVGRNMMRPA
ncbi:winged helix-turn-helix transcriptional regulator [Hymenobacter terrenus]|uniref:winged helix-turn-helix transcriptional regulator n=1 Tax=Hymenobacter terrenus TaxID=1629124 RepID=UPI0009081062|nr:helix-turn-helix domain-containing protein [Hymenobacter terrenus]